jgi:hypothetical protein
MSTQSENFSQAASPLSIGSGQPAEKEVRELSVRLVEQVLREGGQLS